MTNLDRDLAEVVIACKIADTWDCTGDDMRCLDGRGCECEMTGDDRPDAEGMATHFIRTHHDEIARDREDAAIGRAYMRWYAAAKGYRNVIADAAHEAIMKDSRS